jgi:DinB superfamily
MNAQELYLLRYRSSHPGMSRRMLADLTDEQVRRPPCPGVNTLTWLAWHMARVEDIGINRFVSDGEQVFTTGDWDRRLGVARRDLGTGMTPDEVLDLSGRIDLPALHAYWDAVEERTVAVVQALCAEDLDTILDATHVHRVFAHDELDTPDALWVRDYMEGQPRGYFLIHLGLTHIYVHWGEAQAIRGLYGHPGR